MTKTMTMLVMAMENVGMGGYYNSGNDNENYGNDTYSGDKYSSFWLCAAVDSRRTIIEINALRLTYYIM